MRSACRQKKLPIGSESGFMTGAVIDSGQGEM